MKSILIIIVAFFTITPNNYDKETLEALDSCSAVLKVDKNRNSKYIDKGSVNFSVTLTNTSDNTSTYVFFCTIFYILIPVHIFCTLPYI